MCRLVSLIVQMNIGCGKKMVGRHLMKAQNRITMVNTVGLMRLTSLSDNMLCGANDALKRISLLGEAGAVAQY